MRLILLSFVILAVAACPPPDGPDDPTIVPLPPPNPIGTWPTPEMNALGDEKCDGLDNDGDGSADNGCSCTDGRACVVVVAGQCLVGEQACTGGSLGDCSPTTGELGQFTTPAVEVSSVTPGVLTPVDTMGPTVVTQVTPECPGMVPPLALVVLEAEDPAMRVWGLARDDGVLPDATADDQQYTVDLINPFGPGVPSQLMKVEAGARLSGEWELDESSVDYQAD